jgi:hypothetical protein
MDLLSGSANRSIAWISACGFCGEEDGRLRSRKRSTSWNFGCFFLLRKAQLSKFIAELHAVITYILYCTPSQIHPINYSLEGEAGNRIGEGLL